MLNGIHHITALASDPQRNVEFYVDVLGLRLVKRTVNFDAPDVYHLYYGDESGQPGTILTFFPFPDATLGKRGTGEISSVALRVPGNSMDFWLGRLSRFNIHIDGPATRFQEQVLTFLDPDGMKVDLVFGDSPTAYRHWERSTVPAEFAVRKLHGVSLLLASQDQTETLLRDTMGFRLVGTDGNRMRYAVGSSASEAVVDLMVNANLRWARQSAGSVHHIAWRVADDESQQKMRRIVLERGLHATEVLDRKYFRSVYFREPGGILFELATDGPGFAVDEAVGQLGTSLQLPSWLEADRAKIERTLPPIDVRPQRVTAGTSGNG